MQKTALTDATYQDQGVCVVCAGVDCGLLDGGWVVMSVFSPGCQDDIESLIRETSDATQLATWCTVYKGELARKRSECHSLNESLRKAKRDVELMQRKLADQTTELTIANGRIAGLEEDIASQVSMQLVRSTLQ